MIRIEFHPDAEQELFEAKSWYRERSKLAARAFATEWLRPSDISLRRQPVGPKFDQVNGVTFS